MSKEGFIILTPKEIKKLEDISQGENVILRFVSTGIADVYKATQQKKFLKDNCCVFEDITDYDSW